MTKLSLLTNTFFRNSFATNKKTGSQRNGIISYVIICLLFGVITGLGTYFFYKYLGNKYPQHTVLITCFIFISLVTIMFSFFQMNVTLFKSPDYDSLASMPIRNNTIIMAKLSSLYFYNLILDFCSLVPALIIYLCWGGSIIGFLIGLLGVICVSIIPLLFVTLIAALVALITAKSTHGNVVSIILYVLFFIAFVALVSLLPLLKNENFFNNIAKALPYYAFLEKAFLGEYINLVWFCLVNIVGVIVIVGFVSVLYTPLNQIKTKNVVKAYKESGDGKVLNINHILFKKEIDLVVHNPLFLLSSYIAPLLVLLMGIITFGIIGKGFFVHDASSAESAVRSIRGMNIVLAMLIASFCTTTYASFSMEGKNFPMLFVYPLDKRKIIQAKTKAGIIPLTILFIICCGLQNVIVGFCQGFEIITYSMWINSILLPVLASCVTTIIGSICGLRYIRTDYTDPNEVLKKSKSMFMMMIYSIIVNVIGIGGYMALISLLSPNRDPLKDLMVTGIVFAYYFVLIVCLSAYLHKRGEKLFDKAIEQ